MMKKTLYWIVLFLLWSMESTMAATVTKTAEQIGTFYGWTPKAFYGTFALNNAITIKAVQPDTASQKNGYYSADSPIDWRLYQARYDGRFDVIAQPGWVITSVQFTYGYKDNVVSKLVDENGTNYYSGQTVQVDSLDTLRMHVENAKSQARISQFSVTYAYRDSSTLVEMFSKVKQENSAGNETIWEGDVAQWKVKNVRRKVTDTLDHHMQGSWSMSGGYIQSVDWEGGIKSVRFDWRQWGVRTDALLKVAVQAGDVKDTVSTIGIATPALAPTMTYEKEVQCKANKQLSIKNITNNADNDRIVFGDIYIVPYLHFLPEQQNQTIDVATTSTYDLSAALINNTDGEGQVVYAIESDETEAVVLKDSILDFSQVSKGGKVVVKAYWNDSLVSTELQLNVKTVPFVGEALVETFSNCPYRSYVATTYVVGDEGIYDWNLTNFQRNEEDVIGDQQATLLNYGGSIYSNGEQEGGMQSLKIDYRAKETNLPIAFTVMVNGKSYSCTQPAMGADTTFQFNQVAALTKNVALAISLSKKDSLSKAHVVIGNISIAPYIMFTVPNRVDTIELGTSSYELTSKLLDNTRGEGQINYAVLTDETGQASLSGSVLDLSGVTASGKIKLKATWGEVTTTMAVFVKDPASGLSTISRSDLPRKQLVDGQVRIVRGDKAYTLVGIPINE